MVFLRTRNFGTTYTNYHSNPVWELVKRWTHFKFECRKFSNFILKDIRKVSIKHEDFIFIIYLRYRITGDLGMIESMRQAADSIAKSMSEVNTGGGCFLSLPDSACRRGSCCKNKTHTLAAKHKTFLLEVKRGKK